MKLFGLLRKPDWEHKDAAIRRRAVQSSNDPVLLGRLSEFAQTDPDPEVRTAALRRIDDVALLERRLRGENDAGVAATAGERLLECLCSDSLDLAAGQAVLLHVHDQDLLGKIAERSPHVQLRRSALERCERPNLWLQRCIHDPDPALRLWLLQRIDAPDSLQKIAEAVRKRDKRLTRAARDKLEALQLAAGDGEVLQRRVLQLCERLARLSRELPDDRDQQLLDLRAEWQPLQAQVDEDLRRRAEGGLAMAEAALSAARGEPIPGRSEASDNEQNADAAAIPVNAEDEGADEVEAVPSPELEALIEQLPAFDSDEFERQIQATREVARVLTAADNTAVKGQQQRLRTAIDALRQQRKAWQAEREQQQREQSQRHLDVLEQALEAGSLGPAREARQALEGPHLARDLQRRLARADESLAKLERWQRWSGSKVRQRLCDEAEALHGSGLHPDALATKVKELQAEWNRLDALEGEQASGPEHGLARRFRALCHRALAPARPYFEKRRELRGERAEEIAALIEQAAQLPERNDARQALRKQLREALQSLDGVAPEKRGEQGRLLRERLTALDAALMQGREDAALGKRKLLAKLRRDLGGAEGESALALAKSAQSEWKRLPRSDRSSEDALWTELRSLVDPLFERVREDQLVVREQQAEADAEAQAILAELDSLAAAEGERLLHASAHLESLQSRWRALRPSTPAAEQSPAGRARRDSKGDRDRERKRPVPRQTHPWESRFEAAAQRVLDAQRRAEQARNAQQLQHLASAGALLDQLADTDEAQRETLLQKFQALDLPSDARALLQARQQAILEGSEVSATDAEAAERLAVRAELVAGLESPASSATLRRQEQMQRLAAKLEGQAQSDPASEVRSSLIELQARFRLPAAQRQALQQRILAAHQALEQHV